MCDILALALLLAIFITMRSKTDNIVMWIISYTTITTGTYLLTFSWEYTGLLVIIALVYDSLLFYFRKHRKDV